MATVIHKIYVGAEGNTLSPQESLRRSVSFGKLRLQQIAREYGLVAKTIKNAYSNASFSSVTAATESLGLSDNGFKTA